MNLHPREEVNKQNVTFEFSNSPPLSSHDVNSCANSIPYLNKSVKTKVSLFI